MTVYIVQTTPTPVPFFMCDHSGVEYVPFSLNDPSCPTCGRRMRCVNADSLVAS